MDSTYMGFSSDEELLEKIRKASTNKKVSGIHNSPVRKKGTSFWEFLRLSDSDEAVVEALNYIREPQ
jgi:divalent metal cation (Fe/Co/Zn/Cd) transporter